MFIDFAWRSSKVLVTASRSNLINTNISKAIRPADQSTLITVEIDQRGSVAFAVSVEDTEPIPAPPPTTKKSKFQINKSILKVADEIQVSIITLLVRY